MTSPANKINDRRVFIPLPSTPFDDKERLLCKGRAKASVSGKLDLKLRLRVAIGAGFRRMFRILRGKSGN